MLRRAQADPGQVYRHDPDKARGPAQDRTTGGDHGPLSTVPWLLRSLHDIRHGQQLMNAPRRYFHAVVTLRAFRQMTGGIFRRRIGGMVEN